MKTKNSDFIGTWNIYEMEMWDEDYFNMEGQAQIVIEKNKRGEFKFGLIYGEIDGTFTEHKNEKILEFTWYGGDDQSEMSGSGWVKLKELDILEGEIRIHHRDSSKILARRAD